MQTSRGCMNIDSLMSALYNKQFKCFAFRTKQSVWINVIPDDWFDDDNIISKMEAHGDLEPHEAYSEAKKKMRFFPNRLNALLSKDSGVHTENTENMKIKLFNWIRVCPNNNDMYFFTSQSEFEKIDPKYMRVVEDT